MKKFCGRCSLDLFDEPEGEDWIDRVWGEAHCYDTDTARHLVDENERHVPAHLILQTLEQLVHEINAANSKEQLEGYFDGYGEDFNPLLERLTLQTLTRCYDEEETDEEGS